jgi:hypothetical protein
MLHFLVYQKQTKGQTQTQHSDHHEEERVPLVSDLRRRGVLNDSPTYQGQQSRRRTLQHLHNPEGCPCHLLLHHQSHGGQDAVPVEAVAQANEYESDDGVVFLFVLALRKEKDDELSSKKDPESQHDEIPLLAHSIDEEPQRSAADGRDEIGDNKSLARGYLREAEPHLIQTVSVVHERHIQRYRAHAEDDDKPERPLQGF